MSGCRQQDAGSFFARLLAGLEPCLRGFVTIVMRGRLRMVAVLLAGVLALLLSVGNGVAQDERTPEAGSSVMAEPPLAPVSDAGSDSNAEVGATEAAQREEPGSSGPRMSLSQFARAAGTIGVAIVVLSLTMVYFIVDHLLSLRQSRLIPVELARTVHDRITERKFSEAMQACREQPCLLSSVLHAGLTVVDLGYQDVEKAMEDTAAEQSARLMRRMEYLQLIGTLAPMVGLLGTVWGMIHAFMEFEAKANPAVSELAPGVYQALVTTVMGLVVAVPAFAAFTVFRNRVDELVAEAAMAAERVFADYRRDEARRARSRAAKDNAGHGAVDESAPRIPPVAVERERRP